MWFLGNFIDNKNNYLLDILAINTYKPWGGVSNKLAYSINPHGGYNQVDFKFGDDTEVHRSCSLQWQNRYYVFGGLYEKDKKSQERQVSMVNGKRLERKATLDFNFEEGGCTVLNQITIVLCFPDTYGEKDVCRQSNNPLRSFTRLQSDFTESRFVPNRNMRFLTDGTDGFSVFPLRRSGGFLDSVV